MKPLSERLIKTATGSTPQLTVKDSSYLDTGYYGCYRAGDPDKTVVHRQFIYVEGF